MTELREIVIDAAVKAFDPNGQGLNVRRQLIAALKAAAPLIADAAFTDGFTDGVAAEKQRITGLAAEHERLFVPAGVRSFAALLTEGDTT